MEVEWPTPYGYIQALHLDLPNEGGSPLLQVTYSVCPSPSQQWQTSASTFPRLG